MTRTNKQGIAKKKKLQVKSCKDRNIDMRDYWRGIARRSFEDQKINWNIKQVKDPSGKTYWWYTKGRKVCLETKLKLNPNGYCLHAGKLTTPYISTRLRQLKWKQKLKMATK